jgi:hypothetical protein
MTPKVKENKAFANCFRDWIAVIQQNQISVERTLPERIARADGQEHSDGARLFDDHVPFEEEPEEHSGRNQPDTLCEKIKRLGYAQNNQVRLYGEVFDLVSDPVSIGENFVFVDALDRKGHVRRVRIPRIIVQMARIKRRAA